MITIIVGTNRIGSRSQQLANYYLSVCQSLGLEVQMLSLATHNVVIRDDAFISMEEQYLKAAQKIIVIAPEYNGGMPGILKLMLDNTDCSAVWKDKKIALVGLATGRAGNLRGMDQLAAVFSHMSARVYYYMLPISSIQLMMDASGDVHDLITQKAILNQVEGFMSF